MFSDPYPVKNRRMNSKEYMEELWLATWMKRPPCTMIHDKPFYPWLPPTPVVPSVNFKLNFDE